MERIALADKFFDLVLNGFKTTTIRAKHRDYKIGDGQFYSDNTNFTIPITITGVEYKTFGELNNDDSITDGFANADELKNELLKFYPHLTDLDEITKVKFITG